jgi:hypothetical protein
LSRGERAGARVFHQDAQATAERSEAESKAFNTSAYLSTARLIEGAAAPSSLMVLL